MNSVATSTSYTITYKKKIRMRQGNAPEHFGGDDLPVGQFRSRMHIRSTSDETPISLTLLPFPLLPFRHGPRRIVQPPPRPPRYRINKLQKRNPITLLSQFPRTRHILRCIKSETWASALGWEFENMEHTHISRQLSSSLCAPIPQTRYPSPHRFIPHVHRQRSQPTYSAVLSVMTRFFVHR